MSTLLPMCSRIDRERFLHPFAGNTVKGSQTIEDLRQDGDRFGSVLYSFAAVNAGTLQIDLTSLVNDLAAGVPTAPNRRSISATMFGWNCSATPDVIHGANKCSAQSCSMLSAGSID